MLVKKNYDNSYKLTIRNNSQARLLSTSPKLPQVNLNKKTGVSFGRSFFKNTFLWSLLEGANELIKEAGNIAYAVLTKGLFDNYKTKLAEPAEAARKKSTVKVLKTIDKGISSITKKDMLNQYDDPIEIYGKKLEKVLIPLSGDGKEQGLNRIIGLANLKTNIYNDVLMPLCDVINGQNTHSLVPNGINFFGPKGTGKTYFAEQLAEHYVAKGGYYEKINLSGDATNDKTYLSNIFSTAKIKFNESGRKRYTMIFIDELEKALDKNNIYQRPVTEKLLKLTKNCKENGVIFLSTANYLDKVRPAFLKNSRTDLRVPIGHIASFDLADVINYYLKKDNLPHSSNINFQEVVDAVKTKKLQYKPKDVESRLLKEADNFADYGGELTTQTISDALVLSRPEFNEAEHFQFNSDKTYASRPIIGGLYKY